MIADREEVYRASLSSWGNYPLYSGVKRAFRAGWRYKKRGYAFNPIDIDLEEYLDTLYSKYQFRDKTILAAQTCKVWTRCLWWPRQVAPRGQPRRYEVMIIPIFEEQIVYNKEGTTIEGYRPIIMLGQMPRHIDIPAKDAVLWKNGDDIFGSQYDGQSSVIPIYKTVVRGENITDTVTGIIQRRGNGYLVVQVAGADEDRLNKYKEQYQDPSTYAVFFTNDKTDIKAVPAMSQGFNFSETLGALGQDLSRGSAFPNQRMKGENEGKLAGAETIQDAQAETYSTIQEDFEPYILQSYYLMDRLEGKRGLKDENFQIDFETEVRMDPQRRANILATVGQALAGLKSLVTVNESKYLLHLPLVRGPDGEKLLVEHEKQFMPEPLVPEEQPGDPIEEGRTNKEGDPKGAPQDPAAYNARDLNKEISKDAIVKAMTDAGASYKQINAAVMELFGAGVSNTKIAAMRNGNE